MSAPRRWGSMMFLVVALAAGCSGSTRGPGCGDGAVAGQEVCDDGNTVTETECAPGIASCSACAAACDALLSLTGPALALAGGDAQIGAAGSALAEPLRVRVTKDGAAVPGVAVTWAITEGGGSLSALTTTTDATGEAAVLFTVGIVAGAPQRVQAAATGFAGAPVTFSATSVPGPPVRIAFRVQPTTTMSTAVISPAPQIVVLDAHDNVSEGAVGIVSVALEENPTGAVLAGRTLILPVGGTATYRELAIDRMGSGYRLTAWAPGLPAVSSDPFDVTAHLAFVGQPSEALAGAPMSPAVTVRATEGGAPLTELEVVLALEGGGEATLGGATRATTDATGTATFDALALDRRGSAYRLIASATPPGTPVARASSAAFDVLAVDQEQPTIDRSRELVRAIGGDSQQVLAQVVTVAEDGALAAIRVPVACAYGTLTVEVRDVAAGAPGARVITSESFPASVLGDFAPTLGEYPLLRFATPASFSAGDLLALVLRASSSCGLEPGPAGDPYPGGDGFFDAPPNPPGWIPLGNPAYDLPFQTLMR